MSQEFMARAAFCQLGSRRVDVRRSSSGGVISVLGTPLMTARRQPQAHSACPTGGERVGAASTSLRLRFAVPTVIVCHRQLRRLAGGRGLYLHWLLGVGKQREDPGYEQLSVSLSQLPEGLLDFVHLQATRCLLLARAPRVLRGGGNTHLDR